MVEAIEVAEKAQEVWSRSWFRGPIQAVLLLDQETLIASCGRTMIVFDIPNKKELLY